MVVKKTNLLMLILCLLLVLIKMNAHKNNSLINPIPNAFNLVNPIPNAFKFTKLNIEKHIQIFWKLLTIFSLVLIFVQLYLNLKKLFINLKVSPSIYCSTYDIDTEINRDEKGKIIDEEYSDFIDLSGKDKEKLKNIKCIIKKQSEENIEISDNKKKSRK